MLTKEYIYHLEQTYFLNDGPLMFVDEPKIRSKKLLSVYKEVISLTLTNYTASLEGFREDKCVPRKKRSLIDIFRLCHYYNKCSLYEFFFMIKDRACFSYVCPDINRCVVFDRLFDNYRYRMYSPIYGFLIGKPCDEFEGLTFTQFLNKLN